MLFTVQMDNDTRILQKQPRVFQRKEEMRLKEMGCSSMAKSKINPTEQLFSSLKLKAKQPQTSRTGCPRLQALHPSIRNNLLILKFEPLKIWENVYYVFHKKLKQYVC